MGKKAKLADIVKCCEQRFNRGSADQWKYSDFGALSQEICRDTGVAISAHTLKRILGKVVVDEVLSNQLIKMDCYPLFNSQDGINVII